MQHFRTELNIPRSKFQITHQDEILLIGSCFSQNIGLLLQEHKFVSNQNPYGTIFHPVAMAKILELCICQTLVTKDEFVHAQGVYLHPNFHSNLGDTSLENAVSKTNEVIQTIHEYLKNVKYIFITFGTSIGYRLKSNNEIVANCHKLPANLFIRESVTLENNLFALIQTFELLKNCNSNAKIILTVSPVRHIKDGIIENSKSKATLLSMSHALTEMYQNVSYFPAYEWMIDDLRDYRFYSKDMIHPNEQAIEYIWEKFSNHFFDQTTKDINIKIERINKAINHKPFNANTKEHLIFLKKLQDEIGLLQSSYDWVRF